jgi:hypothetical protein
MTTLLKNTRFQHTLLFLGVPLVTTLVLLIGTVALHLPGSSLFSFAHAMTLQATCASTQGTQQTLCNQHNPIAQGCTQDAQTVEKVSVFDPQNTVIGEVDLRHSQACQAYWVRTIANANASHVQAIDAIISFNNGTVQDHQKSTIQPGQRLLVFTDMVQPTMVPQFAGVFHLQGQAHPLSISL